MKLREAEGGHGRIRERERKEIRDRVTLPVAGDTVVYVGHSDCVTSAPVMPAVVIAVRGLVVDLRIVVAGGFGPPRTIERHDVPCNPFGKSDCWRWK